MIVEKFDMMVSTAAAADVVAQFNGIVDCATNNSNNGGIANKEVIFESNGNGMLYGKSGCITVIPSTANNVIGSSATESSSTTPVPPSISVVLTIRLLMQGKEVGSIIGKRGDHVKQIRETSGAKVNISDGSCPERIVTITGGATAINKAFSMVARKFEEDLQALPNSIPKPPITMRLIVPATQCGSLIGKGGSKIKEIREKTGASIQVATEMLPSSTERAVTISGTCEALTDCMLEVCQILLEAPPKGTTLPFRPKPAYNPLVIASSAAAAAAAAQQQATQHIAAAASLMQQQQPAQQLTSTAGYFHGLNHQLATVAAPPFIDTAGVHHLSSTATHTLNHRANPQPSSSITTTSATSTIPQSHQQQQQAPGFLPSASDFGLNAAYLNALGLNGGLMPPTMVVGGGAVSAPLITSPPQQQIFAAAMNQYAQSVDPLNGVVASTSSTPPNAFNAMSAASFHNVFQQQQQQLLLQQQQQFDPTIYLQQQQQQQLLSKNVVSSNNSANTILQQQQLAFFGWQQQQQLLQQQQQQYALLQQQQLQQYATNGGLNMLTGRIMSSNGTPLKVAAGEKDASAEIISATQHHSNKSSTNPTNISKSSASKRFSPY